MASLYTLKDWRAVILSKIENGEEGLQDTLESIDCAIDEKLEGYAMVIRNLEADATAYEAEEKRFKEKKQAARKGIERMKQAIQDAMIESGKDEIKTTLFSLKLRNNAPAVHITDESLIPDLFFRYERTVKKEELKKQLREMPVPGAELRASRSLQIK